MYGLKTIHQLNRENAEAQRIVEKHAAPSESTQQEHRLSAAERVATAQETMQRILNGSRG